MKTSQVPQTLFDQMVSSDQIQMMKAIIPYLPGNSQRLFCVYSKFSELFHAIMLFSPQNSQSRIQSVPEIQADPLEILQDVRSYCQGIPARQLDDVMRLIATVQMLQVMNEST